MRELMSLNNQEFLFYARCALFRGVFKTEFELQTYSLFILFIFKWDEGNLKNNLVSLLPQLILLL